MPDTQSTLDLLQKAGLLGALILFSWMGAKRIICWGYQLEESNARELKTEKECEAWRQVAEERGRQIDTALDHLAQRDKALTEALERVAELTEILKHQQQRRR
jgi:hypothetical protein